ncbi:dipeptidyl peptidase III [Cordyceps militaris]|uniref:Dipeptidyl peptidase III n=1 Tax=Cordyceps militaris TaxID=73501 RepID=A0A2H4SCT7_CORMI|nr:dipeptidyl peptidase III [Cordyceps militaris]
MSKIYFHLSKAANYWQLRSVLGGIEGLAYNPIIRFIITTIYKVLGYSTGKLLTKVSTGKYNFNKEIKECRAMLILYYLTNNKEVLSVFGYTNTTTISAEDRHNLLHLSPYWRGRHSSFAYIQCAGHGLGPTPCKGPCLRESYLRQTANTKPKANFAILKHLLLDGGGVISVKHNQETTTVEVSVDRSKISSHGRPSLGRMLRCIHI